MSSVRGCQVTGYLRIRAEVFWDLRNLKSLRADLASSVTEHMLTDW